MKRNFRILVPYLLPLIALLVPLLSPSDQVLDFIIFAMTYGLLAMSLNLLLGYTGLVSFGHAMFFALGAYGFALLLKGGWSTIAAFAGAVCGTALIAFVVGTLCVRLKGAYFSFLTLAFGMLFYNLIEAWGSVTGGDAGLSGMIRGATLFGMRLSSGLARYYFVAVVFATSAVLLLLIVRSSFGVTLRIIRDNESRTGYLGINVYVTKLIGFTVAGTFAGVAGTLAPLLVAGAYPSMAYWSTSGDAVFAVLLGGSRVFYGPLAGASILLALIDLTTRYTGNTSLALGALILFLVLILRGGPIDLLYEWIQARSKSRRPSGGELESTPKRRQTLED